LYDGCAPLSGQRRKAVPHWAATAPAASTARTWRAHDAARRDLRQAGDRRDLADQRQQAVVPPGCVIVGERSPVGAGLEALDAQRVRARPGRDGRFAGAGHGDHHDAARVLQGTDHPGGRAAEGEADDRRRTREQGRDLASKLSSSQVASPRPAAVPSEPRYLASAAASEHGVPGTNTFTPKGCDVAARTAAISAAIAPGVL
jgi:hypothetical protein